MGRVVVQSKVIEKQNLQKDTRRLLSVLEELFNPLFSEMQEKGSETRTMWENIISDFRTELERPNISLEEARILNEDLRDFVRQLADRFAVIVGGERVPPEEILGEDGKPVRRPLKFSEQKPETRDPLVDLEHIRESAKSGLVKVSSDLWKSSTGLFRDSLGLSLISEETRRNIHKKEEKGQLIAGTLVGLKGGGRYLKVFNIALAQTLYEQSKYYNTQDNLSGVPRELISQYVGEGAIVEKIKDTSKLFKGGERPYPIVLLVWEDIAKKMSPDGKISGGKDLKVVRDFVQGYSQKVKDPKTGKEKNAYIPGLLGREYLVEGEKTIVGVPYMNKIFSLYPKDSPDKEVGIAVQLSPLFAQSLQFGYTGIRSDTIQRLGGAKQKEITINLFYYLAYNRGVPTQKGRKRGEFPRIKRDLLEELSEGIDSYKKNPGRREADFREAVQKCIDAKILLPGKTRHGLRGYREEKNPTGEIISVFVYNPDYLKGEEVNLFTEIEDQ